MVAAVAVAVAVERDEATVRQAAAEEPTVAADEDEAEPRLRQLQINCKLS